MARRLSKRKMPDREKKQIKNRWKMESSVFDKPTMMVLSGFIKKRIISSLDYPMATGKEADVFRATTEKGYAAVKIYRIETSNFFKMQDYMVGDPRFSNIKNGRRDTVFAWTRKEFRNLMLFNEAGVASPKPVAFKSNVLVMEFLGEEGIPDSTLKQVGAEDPGRMFKELLGFVRKLYLKGIVHADLSEYNVLVHSESPYVIDVGQSVLLNHPKALEFLKRDIRNLLKYFKKQGVRGDEKELLEYVRGPVS